MYCKNCGEKLEAGSTVCNACNASIDQEVEENETNKSNKGTTELFCIIGLILCVCGICLVGIPFNIVGMNKIKGTDKGGHGLALAGNIVSCIWLPIQLIYVVLLLSRVIVY